MPDFDNDGRLTLIRITRRADANVHLPPVFEGLGQERLTLHVRDLDSTDRTHVAIRRESTGARLLIYDGPIRMVYAWDGEELSVIQPTVIDAEILSAMGTRDMAGTFEEWLVYTFLKWPMRVVYMLGFFLVVAVYRRNTRVGPKGQPISACSGLAVSGLYS